MRGRISEKTYQRMKFESEIAYLNRLKELYAEGSQERAEIEKQITDKLQADKLAVGDVTNMYVICQKLEQASHVVRP